jgi:hypothetical protein
VSDQEERFTIWHGLLLAEGSAPMIVLATPLTPPRFGSGRRLTEMFIAKPSYLQEVAVSFVFVNLLLVVLGVVFVIWVKLQG